MMKTEIFMAAIFIYLVGLFYVSIGQAEIVECNSTTIVEIFAEEDCPDCPLVLACDEGYSCQPDDVLPPNECAKFLAKYTNPEQAKLPANRVYPMGQKMMLTAWLGKSAGDLAKMKLHGFTMQGPEWNTSDLSYLDKAISAGLRSAHRITGGATNAKELKQAYANDGAERVFKNSRSRIRKVTQVPKYNANVDVWLTGVEELSSHIGDGKNDIPLNLAVDYLKRMKQIVREEDSEERPLWMSDVTGIQYDKMMVVQRHLDMIGPQLYLMRVDSSSSNTWNTDAVMGSQAEKIVKTARDLNVQFPTKRPRAATASLDALYEPPSQDDNAKKISKRTKLWMFLGLNKGLNGFQFYSWHNYTGNGYSDKQTFNWTKDAYYSHVKLLTDNKLDYVYLWGDRRDDLNIKITSGPTETKGYPSILMANIQYEKDRYIMLTNSAEKTVKVQVSDFPEDCQSFTNLTTGNSASLTSKLNITIEPLGVKLYKISK